MKERVYVETSIISYLTARDSRDVVQLAKQQLTREWWDKERRHYELVVGQPVLDEIGLGDPEAVRLRKAVVDGLESLPLTDAATRLARRLILQSLLPHSALFDAYHISMAAVHKSNFLLTWNCSHINNSHTRDRIVEAIRHAGYNPPHMATPETMRRPGT